MHNFKYLFQINYFLFLAGGLIVNVPSPLSKSTSPQSSEIPKNDEINEEMDDDVNEKMDDDVNEKTDDELDEQADDLNEKTDNEMEEQTDDEKTDDEMNENHEEADTAEEIPENLRKLLEDPKAFIQKASDVLKKFSG